MVKLFGTLGLSLIAIVLTVYSGISHGRIRHASGLGVDLNEEVQELTTFPDELLGGRWVLYNDESSKNGDVEQQDGGGEADTKGDGEEMGKVAATPVLDDEVVRILECRGYHYANYQNVNDETIVSALVLLGPSGPIALHKPEVCYPAQAFKHVSGPDRLRFSPKGAPGGELWVSTFRSPSLTKQQVRVAYGWTTDGVWQAPKDSRREFAGKPFLYKVQLNTTVSSDYDLENNDPLKSFAEDFFATVHNQVFKD